MKVVAWIPILVLHLASLLIFLLQITNGAYVEQFLESVEVCSSGAVGPFSNIAKKRIRLGNYPNNTVMIKMTRWEDFWPSFLNFRCKFQVIAPKNQGVMVVIQAMHLRTKKPTRTLCKDYVKFEQADGFKTGQICGEINENDFSKAPSGLISQRYFYDDKGAVDVSFFTDDKDPKEELKPVGLKMVFTAYSECADMLVNSGQLKRCSSLRTHSCIAAGLFCDGEINCGFNESNFGEDERDCADKYSGGKESSNSGDPGYQDRPASLYVFAVTCFATLAIIIFLVVIACCCIRRFSPSATTGRSVDRDQFPPEFETQFHMHSTRSGVIGGENQQPEIVCEKKVEDLPPPYDALFPTSKPTQKQ